MSVDRHLSSLVPAARSGRYDQVTPLALRVLLRPNHRLCRDRGWPMCEHGYRVRGMLAARSTSGNRKQTPRRLITPFVLASVPNLPLCPSLAPCRAGENAH